MIASFLWGSAFPVLKISYQELGLGPEDIWEKVFFAGIRFLLAAGIVLISFMLKKYKSGLSKEDYKSLFILGIMQTSLQYFFFYNGLANTSGISAAILSSGGSFFVVILSHFVYHDDKIDIGKTIGLLTGFAGIVLVNFGSGFSLNFTFKGEGYLILSALISAIATIYAKKISGKINPVTVSAFQMLFGSLLLLTSGFIFSGFNLLSFTLTAFFLLIYSSFLSATAFAIWYTLLKYNKAGEISIYRFMIPIFGSFLSAVLIPGEKITLMSLIALALVAGGIWFVNSRKD